MEKKQDIINKAVIHDVIGLWRTYGENYRTAVARYKALMAHAKKIGIRSEDLRPLKKGVLSQYPRIPVLDIEDYDELWTYLHTCNEKVLRKMVSEIEGLQYNYYFNTVMSKLCDLKYQVSRHEKGWTTYGPEYYLPAHRVSSKRSAYGRGRQFKYDAD